MSRPFVAFNVVRHAVSISTVRHQMVIKTGPRAAPSVSRFVFTQAVPSTTWTINHPLADFSHVTLLDAAGRSFLASWQRVSATQISIGPMTVALSGTAHIN